MAVLAAAIVAATASGARAGAGSDGAERDEIMARARAEHAQRQGLIGAGDSDERSGEVVRRQQELDDLSARLQRAEQRRNGNGSMPTSELPSGRGAPEEGPASSHADASDRVAVLLVMKPGNRGIRRLVKTADPVLCVDRNCYVSRGAALDAAWMSRARALGAANTLGSRAGACRDSLGCVFRGVALEGRTAVVQPVDLRIISHDRREARTVGADRTCRLERNGLTCDGAIEAADYTMWLVPESVAARVGPSALQSAVAGGLGTGRLIAKAR